VSCVRNTFERAMLGIVPHPVDFYSMYKAKPYVCLSAVEVCIWHELGVAVGWWVWREQAVHGTPAPRPLPLLLHRTLHRIHTVPGHRHLPHGCRCTGRGGRQRQVQAAVMLARCNCVHSRARRNCVHSRARHNCVHSRAKCNCIPVQDVTVCIPVQNVTAFPCKT
jgi:hypothetical protein